MRVKETGEIETIRKVNTVGYEYETDDHCYDSKELEPYFEEESKEMIKIKGKEFSEDTIQKALEQYINK